MFQAEGAAQCPAKQKFSTLPYSLPFFFFSSMHLFAILYPVCKDTSILMYMDCNSLLPIGAEKLQFSKVRLDPEHERNCFLISWLYYVTTVPVLNKPLVWFSIAI